MKKVILAKSAGFCFGVQRAVNTVYNLTGSDNVYTYGPIIHNEEVVKDLEDKGVKVIEEAYGLDDLCCNGKESGQPTVVIRSHGVSRDVYQKLDNKVLNLLHATCPFVLNIHKI